LLLAWFVVALVAQYFGAAASAWWILGLVLQTALAVFLLFKHQFGQLEAHPVSINRAFEVQPVVSAVRINWSL
jgi:hypothetical protein